MISETNPSCKPVSGASGQRNRNKHTPHKIATRERQDEGTAPNTNTTNTLATIHLLRALAKQQIIEPGRSVSKTYV
jgi:hypothetical protein